MAAVLLIGVHRRTGGLETGFLNWAGIAIVHRRTGGLENHLVGHGVQAEVHRRTGGLEKSKIQRTLC